MEEKMKAKLQLGFTLSRWAIDACWSALIFTIVWLVLLMGFKSSNIDYIGIIAVILTIVGLILFFIGRVIVGLQSRKINFLTGRERTDEEQWFLNEMLDIENGATTSNLINQIIKITPSKADDILFASKQTGLIKHYFAVGKIYMNKNIFINRLILIISFIIAIILLFINIILL